MRIIDYRFSIFSLTQYYVLRFVNLEQRMQIWNRRHVAKKSNLYMEEWLTGVLMTN